MLLKFTANSAIVDFAFYLFSLFWMEFQNQQFTGINFAETSRQRRPDDDMLREEDNV